MIVCLFDIDGTLLHSSGAGRKAMNRALLQEFGVDVPIRPEAISGRTDRSIATDHFALHGIENSPSHWERFIGAYLQHLPESMRVNEGCTLPGVVALLDALQQRTDVAVGLLTGNVPRGAQIKLGHCGIVERFDFGAYGDRHHTRDDVAREAWQTVQARFGTDVRREDVWVLGDTPWDVRCAHAIGVRSVAVGTGIYGCEELARERPDIAVADFSDAAPILHAMRLG